MRHYEIVFFFRGEVGGLKTIKWSASGRTFDTKKSAIRYTDRELRIVLKGKRTFL